MFDPKYAVEQAQQKLARQQDGLKTTLTQIDHIEKVEPTAVALIKALRIKRDRQAAAIKATEQLIQVYTKPDPAQLELAETEPKKNKR